jgi:hypothetical protein
LKTQIAINDKFRNRFKYQDVKVIADSITLNQYVALDLSVLNHNLPKESLANSADFEKYIESYLTSNNAKVAYGGYNEEKSL